MKYNTIIITLYEWVKFCWSLDTTCSAFVDQHSQNNSTFLPFNENSVDNTFFSTKGFVTSLITWINRLLKYKYRKLFDFQTILY